MVKALFFCSSRTRQKVSERAACVFPLERKICSKSSGSSRRRRKKMDYENKTEVEAARWTRKKSTVGRSTTEGLQRDNGACHTLFKDGSNRHISVCETIRCLIKPRGRKRWRRQVRFFFKVLSRAALQKWGWGGINRQTVQIVKTKLASWEDETKKAVIGCKIVFRPCVVILQKWNENVLTSQV